MFERLTVSYWSPGRGDGSSLDLLEDVLILDGVVPGVFLLEGVLLLDGVLSDIIMLVDVLL